jgi:predicted metalloprotease with PDZ domain
MVNVVPFEDRRPASPPSPPGYLGLIAKTVDVDWALAAEHGPCVVARARSPAWAAGLRSGDYVASINDLNYDDFHAKMPPPGAQVRIVFFRKKFGRLTAYAELKSPPKAKRITEERKPAVLPGRLVERKDRPRADSGHVC